MISVVTPSFQQLEWLKLCAASVADQKGVQHEHIIQDAGSSGDLEDWARTIPNLSLFVEGDAGMYDAINRGLRRSRGAICSYLNCDEQLLPGALAKVVAFFEEHSDVDVLFGDAILIDRVCNPISYRRVVLPTLSHVRYVHLNTQSCSTFFRHHLVARGLLFDPKWKAIGDRVWMELLLRSNIRTATLNEPLAVFTFTGRNLGATRICEEEAAHYKGRMSTLTWLQKCAAITSHRYRKFLAGAYKAREVTIDIYTPDSLLSRQCRHGRVGFSWPNVVV